MHRSPALAIETGWDGQDGAVATVAELSRLHTSLDRAEVAHLQQLVGEWNLLADLCFADLLLYVRTHDGRWLVIGQVRPATSQTLYVADWIATHASGNEAALLDRAAASCAPVEGPIEVEGLGDDTRMLAIPVRRDDRIIAVLTREWSTESMRPTGSLEQVYLHIFGRFTKMISEGSFPFPDPQEAASAPRVGDGVMVLDEQARVEYASPNAVSALHRVGITANVIGLRLAELGFNDAPVRAAYEARSPATEEQEQTPDVTILTRCIPILEGEEVTGGVLLLRDVSELRRRDRLLLSKDATIREIHHRVKNNLQTISSLLRLQGRRLSSQEAKAAVAESVRRIRTIALVHETLSREAGDDVRFAEIVRPLARMAEEGLQSPDRPVRFRVQGDGGKLPAAIATPLAVVLTELLQNAVDHAFGGRGGGGDGRPPGSVVVTLANDGEMLTLTVVDDGVGLPADFRIEGVTSLGLSIVRTLVTTELAGTIAMRTPTREDFGRAGLGEPAGPGTVVDLRVPVTVER